MSKKQGLVIVRGGGDIGTGTIHRLFGAGFPVLILETEKPAAIRRKVSFCEAVYDNTAEVEGIAAERIPDPCRMGEVLERGRIPLLVDPEGKSIRLLHPGAVVDAILAKQNLGTHIRMAPLTIALGPGFEAGKDVRYVIETMRGHDLGRIITSGTALPNTGIPGRIGGYGEERVIHTAAAGIFYAEKEIGSSVEKGERIAMIRTESGRIPVEARIGGILRGILRSGYPVPEHFKAADIDPRAEEQKNCFTISDKARCIAGSVLELVCAQMG